MMARFELVTLHTTNQIGNTMRSIAVFSLSAFLCVYSCLSSAAIPVGNGYNFCPSPQSFLDSKIDHQSPSHVNLANAHYLASLSELIYDRPLHVFSRAQDFGFTLGSVKKSDISIVDLFSTIHEMRALTQKHEGQLWLAANKKPPFLDDNDEIRFFLKNLIKDSESLLARHKNFFPQKYETKRSLWEQFFSKQSFEVGQTIENDHVWQRTIGLFYHISNQVDHYLSEISAAYLSAHRSNMNFQLFSGGDLVVQKEHVTFNYGSTQGMWAKHPEGFNIIAFRGTLGFRDLLVDLNVWPKKLGSKDTWDHVHSGFYKALQEVIKPGRVLKTILMRLTEEEKRTPLWITGHSLGGALATLLAREIILLNEKFIAKGLEPINLKGVYTFGAPKVGSKQFSSHLEKELLKTGAQFYRVKYLNDLVTEIPSNYTHAGKLLSLKGSRPNPKGWFWEIPEYNLGIKRKMGIVKRILKHNPRYYIERLAHHAKEALSSGRTHSRCYDL